MTCMSLSATNHPLMAIPPPFLGASISAEGKDGMGRRFPLTRSTDSLPSRVGHVCSPLRALLQSSGKLRPAAMTPCVRTRSLHFKLGLPHQSRVTLLDDTFPAHSRIGVNGISAGGGLAAALSLLVRDRGELSLAFQALECPMIDERQCTPSSQQDGLPIWSRSDNEFGWRAYLGSLYGSADLPYVAAPARATDLSGLPPSYLAVGTVDGFRDEVIDYATRLSQAGVPTDLRVYAGAPHGLQIAIGTSLADRWASDLEMWLPPQQVHYT